MANGRRSFQTLRKYGREKRKQLIINAGCKLLSEKNVRSISMKDIADEVGITPSSIYRYFESQDQVFQEIVLYNLAHIESMMKINLDVHTDSSERDAMDRFADLVKKIMAHERTLQAIMLFISERNLPDKIREKTIPIWQKLNHHIAIFLKGIGIEDPDAAVTYAVLASIIGAVVIYSQGPGRNDEEFQVSNMEIFHSLVSTFRPMPG